MRGPHRWLALLVLACLLVPGCLDEVLPDAGPDDGSAAAAAPASLSFDCAGSNGEAAAGVCVRRLAPVGTHLSEPALAWHPGDADVLALAPHAMGVPSVLGQAAIASAVYVSEDRGATWTERFAPGLADPPGSFYGDPAVAFTPDGRLHYAAMALNALAAPDLFVTSSDDLGATWSEPVVLFSGMDREWFAVAPDGTLFLTWQDYPERSFASWSTDSGRSWSEPVAGPEGCITGSPMAFLAGVPHMACSVIDTVGQRVFQRLLRLDPAVGLVPVADVPLGGNGPRLLELAGGGLVLTTYSATIGVSPDGGQSWTSTAGLADLVTIDDAWDHAPQVYWSETDGELVHLLLSEYHRTATPVTNGYQEPMDPHPVAYVVLAADDLSVVQEVLLTPEGAEASSNPPASAAPLLGDDWYAMAWHGDDLAMVWTWAGGIDLAIVRPDAPE